MLSYLPDNPAALRPPIAVVAHDAGAANLIAAWCPLLPQPLRICADGPALRILERAGTNIPLSSLEDAIADARSVLTGTGWGSALEHHARVRARRAGVQSVAVLDHWVNYRERFVRDAQEVLPDLLVVTDQYAEREAKSGFPGTPVVRWQNLYLESEAAAARALRCRPCRVPPERILVVMEPVRAAWAGDRIAGELIALDYFLSKWKAAGNRVDDLQVRIRPHPSDPAEKYADLPGRYPEPQIGFAESASLAEDLAWADMVAGCESFALVVSLESAVPTLCILPPQAPPCRLPHAGLMHLRSCAP